eukprot:scaffold75402_cov68-Phaeocystis_antarctica.AAC.3
MSRTELRAQAVVAICLMHLDAGVGFLVVLDDVVALRHMRLGRDESGSHNEGDEPHPVGHDYPPARQVGAVLSPSTEERVLRRAVLGVREAVREERVGLGIKIEALDDVDDDHEEIRDGEGDDVVSVIPLDRASRAVLALEVGGHV